MTTLITNPGVIATAATDLSTIGSDLSAAHTAAATQTTGILAAAEDEVSAAIADLFSAHGQGFHALGAQFNAAAEQFAQTLNVSASAYTSAEAQAANILTNIFGSPAVSPVPAPKNPTFTGTSSLLNQAETALLRQVNSLLTVSGFWNQFGILDSPAQRLFSSGLLSPIFSNTPPKALSLLLGETVTQSTYQGMPVVQITPAHPDGNYVVALHGGVWVWPPLISHWIDYSMMASQTGATVVVPIYPLVQQGGTAGVVVPKVANLISTEIAAHGAPHVSVLGDSAGGTIGLAAVEYLVATNQAVPASMVLLSPALDLTASNPAIGLVNAPFPGGPAALGATQQIGKEWAGGLSMTNPLVSPLDGSLKGLPPTYVYAGSLDPVAPDVLLLQHEAVAQGAPISFALVNGEFHDWMFLSPDGVRYWPQIHRELGA